MAPRLLLKVPMTKSTVRLDPGFLRHAPAMIAEHAERVRFIDHEMGAGVAALDRRDLGQRGAIPQHAVNALYHDQGVGDALAEPPQALVQIDGVIMAKPDDLGAAQAAAIVNAGVAIGVDHENVSGACQGGQHTEVGHIAGRKNDHASPIEEIRQLAFELHMNRITAVGDPRARGPRSLRAHRVTSRFDALGWNVSPR